MDKVVFELHVIQTCINVSLFIHALSNTNYSSSTKKGLYLILLIAFVSKIKISHFQLYVKLKMLSGSFQFTFFSELNVKHALL
jgi:hypothetical protein